jgi:hypothetical protein
MARSEHHRDGPFARAPGASRLSVSVRRAPACAEPWGFEAVGALGEGAGADQRVVAEVAGCPFEWRAGAGEGGEHVELALAESELGGNRESLSAREPVSDWRMPRLRAVRGTLGGAPSTSATPSRTPPTATTLAT